MPSDPNRPGVTLTREGTHFTVFSRHATHVDLCLYAPSDPSRETARIRMTRGESDLWQAFVPKARAGQLYGYRAHGPWMPGSALRYNPNKLLLDPYALAIVGKPDGSTGMLGTGGTTHFPGAFDNGAEALKSAVVDTYYNWRKDAPPRIPWQDTVLYELHVKGFTQNHPDVPKKLRGTYAGLAHPAVTSYLKKLGVTSLQLLPVHQHLDDQFLLEKGLTNYWGYNTIGFFAPHNEYASNADPTVQVREFKDMVKGLHAAGLEVILDVVYNHTAEGDERGPTLLFRGLDDRMYYRHTFDEHGSNYINITGCGNAVDSATPPTLRLILDSLRYWVTEMHVDGFRFDLAVTVARDHHDNYDANSQFLAAVAQDPVLSQVKLIAEPWDIFRMDSYQVGGFPEPWRELNGKYRDSVRRFWAGDEGSTAEFAKRICGSQDVFGWNQRPALSTINFLTSHDGFTLLDLVSYASKHNEANGEDNRDGDNANHSVSCGVEGPTQDPRVLNLRARLRRSLLATLMTSVGVPFINAGDERGRTQKGNNNAYCQDNELSWIDWSQCDEEMLDFTRRIIALRKSMANLRRTQFFSGQTDPATGIADVTWLEGDASLLCHEEWHDPKRSFFGALLDGQPPVLLLFNRGDLPQTFELPGTNATVWSLIFDTSLVTGFLPPDSRLIEGSVSFQIKASSIACLRLKRGPALANAHC
ncbi:glycogen operon protein [Prosthecobacter fusiformis]|uniref:Glycogen operon protein n=1 Tax=Prosthecobacter fusiformis TaxID=48464 RepID=A0A4R7S2N6_9BACT|nr:glycogen debranching protein GlgX [Prosthecobacter fusiformis]TDU71267.1 glycogen operon protein [Prosthecobacter fusiformis]